MFKLDQALLVSLQPAASKSLVVISTESAWPDLMLLGAAGFWFDRLWRWTGTWQQWQSTGAALP